MGSRGGERHDHSLAASAGARRQGIPTWLPGSKVRRPDLFGQPDQAKIHGSRGRSSAGRASRSQCEGREFDPPRLHQHQVPERGLLAGAGRYRAPEAWKRCHAQNQNNCAGITARLDDRCRRRSLSVPATGGGWRGRGQRMQPKRLSAAIATDQGIRMIFV